MSALGFPSIRINQEIPERYRKGLMTTWAMEEGVGHVCYSVIEGEKYYHEILHVITIFYDGYRIDIPRELANKFSIKLNDDVTNKISFEAH